MAGDKWEVAGRRLRSQEEYEAALRDEAKIEEIRSRVDFRDPRKVLELYAAMNAGEYRFESAVGNDFDDEIYELAEKFRKKESGQTGGGRPAERPGKAKRPGRRGGKAHDAAGRASAPAASGKSSKAVLPDDPELKKEVLEELRRRGRRRKQLVILCSLIAVLSFGYLGVYLFYMERTGADYEELAALKNEGPFSRELDGVVVHKTSDSVDLPDILDEYKTLYNKNKKLIGWLKIADTNIDYPVMQTSNNEYYLDHNFNQEYDKNGSIFLDSACSVYPRSTNLIVYGHHMKSGRMFGKLNLYARESYYEEHRILQFDTIYEKGTYEVMYVFRSKVFNENDITFKYYQFIDANSKEEFNSSMEEMAALSLYDTGVTAVYGDQLLTLSTCDSSQEDGRFVVVAKRIS